MRIKWILLSFLFMGCAATPSERNKKEFRLSAAQSSVVLSGVRELTVTYDLKSDCPNWDAALTIAKRKMGCDGNPPSAEKCQEELPCDVCQFLAEGAWPPAHIVNFPASEFKGIKNTIYGAVLWDPRWTESCPIDDKTRAEFKWALCSGEGIWGFDKVDTLAKAMVHEALHLCRSVGGQGSSTMDKGLWDYLFCARGDAADVVETCWAASGD